MSFVDGQVLTGAQLNAAFALAFQTASLQINGIASEAIAAGAFVHIDWSSGATIRNANGANPALWANGFALAAIGNGAAGAVMLFGPNTAVTVSSGASQVWLSDATPGAYVTTPPSASGSIVQPLSLTPAIPGTGIFFIPQPWVQL